MGEIITWKCVFDVVHHNQVDDCLIREGCEVTRTVLDLCVNLYLTISFVRNKYP